jgi:exo-beta-1,3-glucanase (GH17 family)
MQIVAPYTQWIRTFGTTDGLEKAGLVARSLGLKAAIGAWLGRDLAANEQQITNLINICKAGQCDLAIVGSEVLLRGDLSEAQLIDYIKRVRQAVPAGIPVTTADVYSQFLTRPNVLANIDLVMANFYPYWEGTRVDLAMGSLHARYGEVKAAAGGKQVYVSETGWPSAGDQIGAAVPSAQNASFYFLNFVSWARANNVQYFYFESFDESWKAKYEGPQGAHWGIWDKDGNLKPGMQEVFDGRTIPDNWSSSVVNCDPNSPKLRFTSVPPLGSFDNLFGQVCGVKAADFRIVVYIKVGNGWWVKPFANQPLTTIANDGSWSADITTGGFDSSATVIVAYLVPNGFSPPILLGSPTIPDTLAQNSIAKAEALRCSYSITPASHPFSSTGGTGSVSVSTSDNRCTWTGVSNVNWIFITSAIGTGNGTISFSVAPNTGAAPRTGTLTIAGKTFTVTQTGTGILCGQTLTSSILAGQSHSYAFSGNAGERVRVAVDELGASFAVLSVSLKNSAGTLIAQASGKPAVLDNVSLTTTGSYTIVVSAVTSPTIYNVSLVFTTGRCGTTISCGQAQSNNEIQRAQLDAHRFNGNVGERVRVVVSELQPTFATLFVSLYSSSGTLVAQASGKPAVIGNVGLPATGTYTLVISTVVAPTIYKVELFCSDPSRVPILISEETSTRAIALDSVMQLRDPFPPVSPVRWGADTRTRVMIFAFNLELLPGEDLSIITADAEDASHRVYPLTVEYVGAVPGFDWLSCLVVRLHDGMGDIGDVLLRVTVRGFPSNRVRIGIGHNGGGLPDDLGAVPTPGRKPQ